MIPASIDCSTYAHCTPLSRDVDLIRYLISRAAMINLRDLRNVMTDFKEEADDRTLELPRLEEINQ